MWPPYILSLSRYVSHFHLSFVLKKKFQSSPTPKPVRILIPSTSFALLCSTGCSYLQRIGFCRAAMLCLLPRHLRIRRTTGPGCFRRFRLIFGTFFLPVFFWSSSLLCLLGIPLVSLSTSACILVFGLRLVDLAEYSCII